jgi:hypothetical protein
LERQVDDAQHALGHDLSSWLLTIAIRLSVPGGLSPLRAAWRRNSATSRVRDQPSSVRTARRVLLLPAMPCSNRYIVIGGPV